MRLLEGLLAGLGLFILAGLGLLVVFGWVVPATFGPLVVNCDGMDRPTCTETWQTAATRAVSEGLANNGAHVLFVTIDATPMSGGAWCPSWLDIYWSDGAHISLEGFC